MMISSLKKMRTIIFLFMVMVAIYIVITYVRLTSVHPYAFVNKDLCIRDRSELMNTLCIEDNICKRHPNDTMYIYEQKPDFLQRVDAPVNYQVNVNHSTYVVPNIVHFVQYTNIKDSIRENIFEYHHMMSVLGAYRNHKPDKIYFWLDQEPTTKYWLQLKQIVPMYLIYRERPTSIRGRKITFITKVSNIIRMEAIIEYGGMYFDLDVIVVKSLDPLRKYDATMGKEDPKQFCNAVIIGKPWADFLRLWHQSHKDFDENLWSYHSGKVPFLLVSKYPTILHVEEMAFHHPAYYELHYLFVEGHLWDWRKKNYCVHLWLRVVRNKTKLVEKTDGEVDSWNTTLGEIYRHILYGDGKLQLN